MANLNLETNEARVQETRCDCLFCHSKCPECGSTRIQVEFNIECYYDNHFEDTIRIFQSIKVTELQCRDCDLEIETEWGPDEDQIGLLEPLEKALRKHYAHGREFNYDNDKGSITFEEFNVETKIIPISEIKNGKDLQTA